MSFNLTNLTEYVDEQKNDLIRKSFLEPRTMDLVTIQPGVKFKETINILDTDVAFQTGHCSFDADGSVVFSQRELEVSELRINEEYCMADLNKFYLQKSLNPGSWNESMGELEGSFAEAKSEKIREAIDVALWQGDKSTGTGNNAFFDGYISKIDASGSAIDGNVDGVTVSTGITKSNVIEIVRGIYSVLPDDELDLDVKLVMGYDIYRLYSEALIDSNLFHYRGDEDQSGRMRMYIPGTNIEIVALKGLTNTDRMFTLTSLNYYAGTDLAGEEEQFEFWYSKDDQNTKFAAKFKMGTQVAFPDRIVEFTLVP